MIMIGDVLFFKKKNTFVSKLIANITKSEYTHVGLIVSYDEFSNVFTIIESNRFIRTRIERINFDDASHVIYSIGYKSEETESKIVDHAHEALGIQYDYFQILGLLLSLILQGNKRAMFNSTNKLICSELIDITYIKSDIKRNNMDNVGNVTPQELLEAYPFKMIERVIQKEA